MLLAGVERGPPHGNLWPQLKLLGLEVVIINYKVKLDCKTL